MSFLHNFTLIRTNVLNSLKNFELFEFYCYNLIETRNTIYILKFQKKPFFSAKKKGKIDCAKQKICGTNNRYIISNVNLLLFKYTLIKYFYQLIVLISLQDCL